MAITKDDVKYIAKLAKLRFDDDEAQVFAGEFENILEQFKTLDKLNLDDVKIERPSVAVVRKDERKKCEIEDL
ncbi:MAG: aspartyl/glutamyl-tRNA amidotransferase subunit C, partial [Clostridium sp.]|nr:aspartyl/glutamyl-tRNA amidotransferase subunit C [Clostridium sp.]